MITFCELHVSFLNLETSQVSLVSSVVSTHNQSDEWKATCRRIPLKGVFSEGLVFFELACVSYTSSRQSKEILPKEERRGGRWRERLYRSEVLVGWYVLERAVVVVVVSSMTSITNPSSSFAYYHQIDIVLKHFKNTRYTYCSNSAFSAINCSIVFFASTSSWDNVRFSFSVVSTSCCNSDVSFSIQWTYIQSIQRCFWLLHSIKLIINIRNRCSRRFHSSCTRACSCFYRLRKREVPNLGYRFKSKLVLEISIKRRVRRTDIEEAKCMTNFCERCN